MHLIRFIAVASMMLSATVPALAVTDGVKIEVLPPAYTALEYDPPPAGTYTLPVLGEAANGTVLRSDGSPASLHDFFGDKIALLSFIYSRCTDVAGCPLATAVFYKLKERLMDERLLDKHLRLVTLSFDPDHDTPEVMRRYGEGFQGSGLPWHFLTTQTEQELKPILDGYHQSIQKEYDDKGEALGTYSHILRVYLIDRQQYIRNIYSTSFLHAEVLVNDVKTLLLEEDEKARVVKVSQRMRAEHASSPTVAGDYKKGYEHLDYETRSISLVNRRGVAADLMGSISAIPLGLPPVPVSEDNPITERKIFLGRKLFFDRRLSLNDTFSCAMCHIPEQGFTSNEMATAVGIEGRTVRRNSPTIYNVAYMERLFHDGREYTLEQQIWAPLLAHNEMANPSVGAVIEKLRRMPDYEGLFEAAFNGKGPSMETIGMAIASYERALVSGNSAFDRWYYGKEKNALSKSAKRGFELFAGKAGCLSCHTIEKDYALFTDHRLHNTGIGYSESMRREPEFQEVTVAPGIKVKVARDVIDPVSETTPNDLGLYEITQDPGDRWKYKTPSLRNVALTAPYMHNGSISTLKEVVAFYNRGGVPNDLLDSLIRPLNLSEQEMDDLVAFLESLTGNNIDVLVSDAFAAPVGDLTRADPNWVHNRNLQ